MISLASCKGKTCPLLHCSQALATKGFIPLPVEGHCCGPDRPLLSSPARTCCKPAPPSLYLCFLPGFQLWSDGDLTQPEPALQGRLFAEQAGLVEAHSLFMVTTGRGIEKDSEACFLTSATLSPPAQHGSSGLPQHLCEEKHSQAPVPRGSTQHNRTVQLLLVRQASGICSPF